jgi:hypothetical protein
MRSGMNVFELGCFLVCCCVSFLVVAPLVLNLKLGWPGWIIGLPLGFFSCFAFFQGLFTVAGVVEDRLRRRWGVQQSDEDAET